MLRKCVNTKNVSYIEIHIIIFICMQLNCMSFKMFIFTEFQGKPFIRNLFIDHILIKFVCSYW